MADQGREALEIVMGAMMVQGAVIEFLVEKGVIQHAPLLEHLAAKRVSWEKTATKNALFPIDFLSSMIAGRQTPKPPGLLN